MPVRTQLLSAQAIVAAVGVMPTVLWVRGLSLGRPDGNITGVVVDAGKEIEGKRIELLREMVGGASRLAYMAARAMRESPFGAEARDAARRAEVSLLGIPLESPIQDAEYRRALATAAAGDVAGLIIPDNEEHVTHRRLIVKLAEEARMPALYPTHEFVQLGGLMSYGFDFSILSRLAADDIDLILKGAKLLSESRGDDRRF